MAKVRRNTSAMGRFAEGILPYLLLLIIFLCVILYLVVTKKKHSNAGLRIETETLVESIRSLSELTTVSYYEEIVLRGTKLSDFGKTPLGSLARDGFGKDTRDELVLVARGKVRAGVDLSKMGRDDLVVVGDTVVVTLPMPEYLDVIINPSDYDVFAQSGTWTASQVKEVQNQTRERLLLGADSHMIKREAYKNACQSVESLLRTLGARNVRIEVPLPLRDLPLPSEG